MTNVEKRFLLFKYRWVKMFHDLVLVEMYEGFFACINKHLLTVECKGNLEECEEFFQMYVNEICDHDPINRVMQILGVH